jgi:hypothetical protein
MAVLLEDAAVRVAAVYDIHGNLPALEAALSAIEDRTRSSASS